jgi:hypothetical protein
MSDSTLSRRSAALRRLNRLTKLPTGRGDVSKGKNLTIYTSFLYVIIFELEFLFRK